MQGLRKLRPTPGHLESRRLDDRPGALPNALYLAGGRAPVQMSAVVMGPGGIEVTAVKNLLALEQLANQQLPMWIRITGVAQPHLICDALATLQIPEEFGPLLVETPQVTRLESCGNALALVMHRLRFGRDASSLISDQVGMVLTNRLLISIEETPAATPFATLTEWLLQKQPVASTEDLDDLLHYMVDELLEGIFPMLEMLATRLDQLEDSALRNPKPAILNKAYNIRNNIRRIRQQLWPLRHQTLLFLRQHQPLMGPAGLAGFREMAENVEQIYNSCEILRQQCDAVTDAHLASTSHRMNQIMKTLTIVSTIFAPLTFVAGIYGMNFDNIPEYHWRYGYEICLFFMGGIATIQTAMLWRSGWFEDWTATRR